MWALDRQLELSLKKINRSKRSINERLWIRYDNIATMKAHTFAICLVLVALSGCSTSQHSTQNLGKQDASEIQGTWKLVALEADGKPAPAEIVAALKLVFKGDRLVFTAGEPGFTNYKYDLDPSKKPAMFAMTHEDGSDQGKTQKAFIS
jgi:uncharacterized protein (TIGR03067 family)